jgi:hypothetical protein
MLGEHNEVSLVLAIMIIDDNHHLTASKAIECI